ncbi:uncharacterized protein LOC127594822 [Hippocampus zosterae]|uniref:uncharacterized protein LOC127594822 n=1 Tax=Hippocampus zosterae TaxID=109293 RepID=UPI00223D2875|nr:uncharacterized protein LOC127594822 [Hippocampus zosterae]
MNALKGPISADAAITEYQKKRRDKINGGYTELAITYEEEGAKAPKVAAKKAKKTSKLPGGLQRLIDLIFDTKQINHAMKEIGYDAKKMPLGKLGESTIKDAYKVLNDLEKALKRGAKDEVKTLSSRFYSLIPHDFGRANMSNFVLDCEEKIKHKLDMLQSLSDMKITSKLLDTTEADTDIIDQNYKKLGCKLRPLAATEEIHNMVSTYVANTRGNYKPQIEDIFEVVREQEHKEFNSKLGNNLLLWHGSGVANFVGILSQGLRIAPPEAPASGYLFGKGIYLADMFEKSAMYCRGSDDGSYLILLVEGALGQMNILTRPDCGAKELMEKAKKNSTKCHGGKAPPPSSYKKFSSFSIPLGKVDETKSGSYKGHNEFIVYQKNQARLRYLIRYRLK